MFCAHSVVVNMTQIHHNGGFSFTTARDLHVFFKDVFPTKTINHVCFCGARGLYGAGFLTATKLVFHLVYTSVSYIDIGPEEEFSLATVKDKLDIKIQADRYMAQPKSPLLDLMVDVMPAPAPIQRAVSSFTRLLSTQSQVIELERNNVEQQALLYCDGWYGHYDITSGEKNLQPFFEAGSARMKTMRKKNDAISKSAVESVSVEEVKGLVGGVLMGMPRTRVVHAESLAKACTGSTLVYAVFSVGGGSFLHFCTHFFWLTRVLQRMRAVSFCVAKICTGNTLVDAVFPVGWGLFLVSFYFLKFFSVCAPCLSCLSFFAHISPPSLSFALSLSVSFFLTRAHTISPPSPSLWRTQMLSSCSSSLCLARSLAHTINFFVLWLSRSLTCSLSPFLSHPSFPLSLVSSLSRGPRPHPHHLALRRANSVAMPR